MYVQFTSCVYGVYKNGHFSVISLEDFSTFSKTFLSSPLFSSCFHILKTVAYWCCFSLQVYGQESQTDLLPTFVPTIIRFNLCHKQQGRGCAKSFSGRFPWSIRVRLDYGTKNKDVARWILSNHDVYTKPFFTGLSVHNQHTERLWLDLRVYVLQKFTKLFRFFENIVVLYPVDENHLFEKDYEKDLHQLIFIIKVFFSKAKLNYL